MIRSTEHSIFAFMVLLLLLTYARHDTSHLKILPQVQSLSVVCTASECLCLCANVCLRLHACMFVCM
jgi:hypothetical protein